MNFGTNTAELIDMTDDAPEGCMLTGADTGLFTTSMTSSMDDVFSGGGTALFTTSMAPEQSAASGAGTGLFTTSMVAGNDALAGEATGLFTTSM
jgi:hypothetical protein